MECLHKCEESEDARGRTCMFLREQQKTDNERTGNATASLGKGTHTSKGNTRHYVNPGGLHDN